MRTARFILAVLAFSIAATAAAIPTLTCPAVQVTEGNSGTTPAIFTLTLSSTSTDPVTVWWHIDSGSASSGSDFAYASSTLTFAPGETQKTITVQVYGDTVYESNEYFYLHFYSISGANPSYGFSVVGTIANDDVQPVITADDVQITEGDSGTKQAVITLKSDHPAYGEIDYYTINGTAVSGQDFNYVYYGYVFFNNETQKQISIPIIGDGNVEPNEQFKVHLIPYYYYGGGFGLARSDITVTIVNDDIGVGPLTQNVAKGDTGFVAIDIGNAVGSPLTLAVAASDPCIKAPSTAAINPGSHTATLAVTAVDAPCSARVDVTLPASLPPPLGGKTISAGIRTYSPLTLSFDPASPRVYVGQTITAHVTVSPFDGPVNLPLQVIGDTAAVPASVNVDANGGSFTIKGLKQGPIVINATLPPQNGNGTATLYGDVLLAPSTVTILQVSPASGPTAGGTRVTFAGANFRGDCAFFFGGVPATSVSFGSTAVMTATTPAHVTGTVDVTASCGSESFTFPNAFTYTAGAPTIAGVTPSFGSTAGGTTVRITGRDLAPNCWAFFDGLAARNVSVAGATEVIATTPAHDTAAVAVSVRCGAGGDASLAAAFNYSGTEEPSPVITSVNPLSAAPGQPVTIAGSRFGTSDTVKFDSTIAPLLGTTPDSHLVALPALPLGKVSVNVIDRGGHVSTTGPIFTVLEGVTPQVTKVSPTSAPAGGELTIDGNGFRAPYSFALGDAAARTVTMSYTRAVIRISSLAPGPYELRVVNGSGQTAALGGNVTVTATGVVVGSVSPVCVSSEGGATIAIAGSGFVSGATVTIGGVAATNVNVVDAAHINATVPALPPGWATVAVTNPSDGSGTATNALRVYSPFDPDGCGVAPRPRPARR